MFAGEPFKIATISSIIAVKIAIINILAKGSARTRYIGRPKKMNRAKISTSLTDIMVRSTAAAKKGASGKRKAPAAKAPAPTPKRAYSRIYHAFFLRAFGAAPESVQAAMKKDDTVEFLTADVFLANKENVGLTDPMPRASAVIIKFLEMLHSRIEGGDSAVIAAAAAVPPPRSRALAPSDADDTRDEVYTLLAARSQVSVARKNAAILVNVARALADVHVACILVCHRTPKEFLPALCHAAGLAPLIIEIARAACTPVVRKKKAAVEEEAEEEGEGEGEGDEGEGEAAESEGDPAAAEGDGEGEEDEPEAPAAHDA
jgi:hypothetical protein